MEEGKEGCAEIIVKVTPDMVSAGADELWSFDRDYDDAKESLKTVLRAVFGDNNTIIVKFV